MKYNQGKISVKFKESAAVLLACCAGLMTSCTSPAAVQATIAVQPTVAAQIDAVSSASVTYYENSSLTKEQLWEALEARTGGCTIASVNADGTPNLIVAVPGTAEDKYVFFTWADNLTKENAIRTGEVEICYYIYDAKEEAKEKRNTGARARLRLVTDQAVIDNLAKDNPMIAAATVFEIEELLPLG